MADEFIEEDIDEIVEEEVEEIEEEPTKKASGYTDGIELLESLRDTKQGIPDSVTKVRFDSDPKNPRRWFFILAASAGIEVSIHNDIVDDLENATRRLFVNKKKSGKYTIYTN